MDGIVDALERLMRQQIRRVFMPGKEWQRSVCFPP